MSEEQKIKKTSFSEKLRVLFDSVRSPSGHLYNVSEATDGINADGYVLSRSYLSALREGARPVPKPEVVEAIAKFFHVPPSYFYDESTYQWMRDDIALLVSLRDSGIRSMSAHAVGLDRESLEVITETIKEFRRMKGLPKSPDEQPAEPRKRRTREELRPQTPEKRASTDR